MILRRERVFETMGLTTNAWDILAETAADLETADWAGEGSLAYCKDEETHVRVKTQNGWEAIE